MVKLKINSFPSIRVTQQLKEETIKASEIEDINISEYIREAVKEKNKKVLKEG